MNIFPDGIRTSGQHEPVYKLLKSFEEFPEHISGSTVWTKDDFVNNPEKWTHRFTVEELEELGATSDKFIADGIPLVGITRVGRNR